jgi:hypothetical protein
LKSESEERETWTAESLRAASVSEDLSSQARRLEETLAVNVSRYIADCANSQVMDLVNVVARKRYCTQTCDLP